MDMADALAEYRTYHEVANHSPKTIRWYLYNLTTFQQWLQANGHSTLLSAITVADARAFLAHERQRHTKYDNTSVHPAEAAPLSDQTIAGYVRAIKAFWNFLVQDEYLRVNPMAKLQRPTVEQRDKDVITDAEMAQLLSQCNQRTFLGSRMYALLALLYDSGPRIGEVARLTLDDVDLHNGLITIRRSKARKQRTVPFSVTTRKALRKYLVHRHEFVGDVPCDAFFLSKDRGPLTPEGLTRVIKRFGDRAGVPRLHAHLLRHSMGVAYIMNEGNQHALKRILGHSQLSTTDIYVDLAERQLQTLHTRHSPMDRIKLPTPQRKR